MPPHLQQHSTTGKLRVEDSEGLLFNLLLQAGSDQAAQGFFPVISQVLKASKDRGCTASLGNLLPGLTFPTVKYSHHVQSKVVLVHLCCLHPPAVDSCGDPGSAFLVISLEMAVEVPSLSRPHCLSLSTQRNTLQPAWPPLDSLCSAGSLRPR